MFRPTPSALACFGRVESDKAIDHAAGLDRVAVNRPQLAAADRFTAATVNASILTSAAPAKGVAWRVIKYDRRARNSPRSNPKPRPRLRTKRPVRQFLGDRQQ